MRKSKAWLCISCVLTVCFTAFIFYNAMQAPYESNLRSENIAKKLQSIVPAQIQTYKEEKNEISSAESVENDTSLNKDVSENTQTSEQTQDEQNDVTETETFEAKLNKYVRKAAHVTEYALLGAALCGIFLCIYAKKGRIYITLPILYVVGVAIADEYLQTFFLRSGNVKDVLLDFVSGMAAFLIVYVIVKLVKRRKSIKENA